MTNQNIEYFSPPGKDLASRTSARVLRQQVESVISGGKSVIIDLTHVDSISESYADELFAVLVENYGLEWFSNTIKILHNKNYSAVLRSVATAIKRRLEMQKIQNIKGSVDHLIAAKKLASYNQEHHC